MRKKPVILHKNISAKSRLFTIETLDIEFGNGTTVRYERLKGSKKGAVLIVPLLDDNTVVLIREYAAGVGRYEVALPKGKIDADEQMLQAAERELKEETGFGAKSLKHITSYTIAPGYLSHVTHIILAEELYPEKLAGDEPEEIEVIKWPLGDLQNLLTQNNVTEARSIAALYQIRHLKNLERHDS